jgi:hypothetical protein
MFRMKSITQSLIRCTSRSIHETKDLRLHDLSGKHTYSGINATVFGGGSTVGLILAEMLATIGSRCILPYRRQEAYVDEPFAKLRRTNNFGSKTLLWLSDFTDEKELNMSMRNMNTVICLIGSRYKSWREADFELPNILIPRAIARSVRNTPTVKR